MIIKLITITPLVYHNATESDITDICDKRIKSINEFW